MSFGLGILFFCLGSIAIGLCILAIPGRGVAAAPQGEAGHVHGHGAH